MAPPTTLLLMLAQSVVTIAAAAVTVTAPATSRFQNLRGLRSVSSEEVLAFQRNGHVLLNDLFHAKSATDLRCMVQSAKKGRELATKRHALRTTLGLSWTEANQLNAQTVQHLFNRHIVAGRVPTSFLQYINLWRESGALEGAALALGAVAAALLGVRYVRLYGDALFVKRPGDTATAWHDDLAHVPLDTASFLTLWIPLQPVESVEDGGSSLLFASGSHCWDDERRCPPKDLKLVSPGQLRLGDATAHHGLTLHAAPELGDDISEERCALALSYFADGAKRSQLADLGDDEDEERESFQDWAADVPIGAPAQHRLLPIAASRITGPTQAVTPRVVASQSVAATATAATPPHGQWRVMKCRTCLLEELDRISDAIKVRKMLLQSQIKHLGPMHADVLEGVRELARLLRTDGMFDEAEVMFRKALHHGQAELGLRHRTTLLCASGLGALLQTRGHLAEAERLHRMALEGFKAELGMRHPNTRQADEDLRNVLASLRAETKLFAKERRRR